MEGLARFAALPAASHAHAALLQLCKNLTLAGVGSLTLVDDTPCARAPKGNFLVPCDSPPAARRVAERSHAPAFAVALTRAL